MHSRVVRSVVLPVSVAATTVAGPGVAYAAESQISLGLESTLTGPVGLAAVGFGLGGLVAGLVRHRRSAVAQATVESKE